MAVLVSIDILYAFPSATLHEFAFNTDELTRGISGLLLQYVIWFALIGVTISTYTGLCLAFYHPLRVWNPQYTPMSSKQLPQRVRTGIEYWFIALSLAGTAIFDFVMFYSDYPISEAYYDATQYVEGIKALWIIFSIIIPLSCLGLLLLFGIPKRT